MKCTLIATILISFLFMCGCNNTKGSSSSTENKTTITTTTMSNTFYKQVNSTAKSDRSEKKNTTTKSMDTSSENERQVGSVPAGDANNVIGGKSLEYTTQKPSEIKSDAAQTQTVKKTQETDITNIQTQSTTEYSKQSTITSTLFETKSSVDNGNVMTDDGLNWSPLTPVG